MKISTGRQIKIGVVIGYSTTVMNIIIGLMYTPWMVSKIGQSNYGLYALATSIITFFAMDFGLSTAVTKFLSKYLATKDFKSIKKFLGITFKIFFVLALIFLCVLIGIYFNIDTIYKELTADEVINFKVIYLIITVFMFVTFPFKPFEGILISFERFIFCKILDLFTRLLSIVLIILALVFNKGLLYVVTINAFVGLLKVFIQFLYINKTLNLCIDFSTKDKVLLKEITFFSAWSTLISIAQRLLINITPSVIAALSGSAEIAIFSIGKTIEGYVWTFTNIFGGMLIPRVSKLMEKSDYLEELEVLFIKIGRIQFLVIGFLVSTFIIFGREFLYLWMGVAYKNSYYVTLCLIIPSVVTLTQDVAYTALIAINEIRYRAYAMIISTVTSIILSLIFTKYYGAIGSAIAIFIGSTIGLIIFMNIIYHKILKIDITNFFINCHLKLLFPNVILLLTGYFLNKINETSTLISLLIKLIIAASIYSISMWIFALNDYEKSLVKKVINGFKFKIDQIV